MINNMVADVLATPGAIALTTMIFSMLDRINSVPARKILKPTVTWYRCMMCLFNFLSTFSFIYIRQVTQLNDVPWCPRGAAADETKDLLGMIC